MIFFLCISFFIKYIHKVELKTWPLIQSSNESCNTLSHYHQIQDFLKKPSQELKSLFCFRFLLIPRRPGTLNKKEIYFGHPKIYTGNMYLFCFFKKVLTPFCKKGVGPKFVGFLWHFLNLPPSLNTQSCMKGLLVVRDFCCWAVWASGPVLKKKWGLIMSIVWVVFSCFQGQKKLNFFENTLKVR